MTQNPVNLLRKVNPHQFTRFNVRDWRLWRDLPGPDSQDAQDLQAFGCDAGSDPYAARFAPQGAWQVLQDLAHSIPATLL